MKRNKKLGLERLETRDTPAVFGIPWVNAQNVTLSFAPDGTNVSGASSNLFGHLQADGLSTSAFEGQILRAVQSWTSQANINVGVVADSGAALGTAGLSQGDSRFGDIRISMRPLQSGFVAITSPPGTAADTSGGDVILNSSYQYSIGGKAGTYDPYSVVVHELGHSFGLADNTDPTSVMYDNYGGVRTGLSASDVASIDALYSTRPADPFQAAGITATGLTGPGGPSATTLVTATAIPIPAKATNTLLVNGDITSGTGVDLFQFTVPDKAPQNGTTILFRSQGVSLLAADVSIVDAKGHVVGSATSNGQSGVFLTLSPNMKADQTYYVAIEATAGTTFDIGSYKLAVTFGTNGPGQGNGPGGPGKGIVTTYDPTATSAATTYLSDGGTSQTFAIATNLLPTAGTTSQAHFEQFAQLTSTTDVNFFTVQAPATATGTTNLLVSVRSLSSGLPPVLQFTDANGNLLQAQQLSGTATARVYQIAGVAAGATFGVQVTSPGSLGAPQYDLQVDFVATAIVQAPTGSGILSPTNTTDFHTLVINSPQTISFNFLASADGLSSPTTVWVQLFDSTGNTVSLWMVQTGLVSTESLLLQPGEYTFKIWAAFGVNNTGIDYSLNLSTLTDLMGIALVNTTMTPSTTTTTTATTTTTTTTVVPPPYLFYTYNPSYYAWLMTPSS